MKTILHRFVCVMVAVLGAVCLAQDGTIRAVSGAMVSVFPYNRHSSKIAQDAIPVEVSVDNGETWSRNNLRNCPSMAKYGRKRETVVWDGFLEIPAKGAYVFSLTMNKVAGSSMRLLVSGKELLRAGRIGRRDSAASGVFHGEKGHYPVRLILHGGMMYDSYTLKFWPKDKPLKKTVVTPSMLFHKQ